MADKGYLHPFWDGRRFENGVGEVIRTIVELKMQSLSYYIRSEPNWQQCLNDADGQRRWRSFATSEEYLRGSKEYLRNGESHRGTDDAQGNREPCVQDDLRAYPPLTESQVDWVIEELAYYAQRRSDSTTKECQPSCFERIFESDSLFTPVPILQDLNAEITKCFLSSPTTRKAYIRPVLAGVMEHTSTILDLIHPFSYPIISGRTLRFETEEREEPLSRRTVRAVLGKELGAIPTDFSIPHDDGEGVRRKGYISGIPPTPQYAPLLERITAVLGRTMPLFEATLTSLHRSNAALMLPRIPPPSKSSRKSPNPSRSSLSLLSLSPSYPIMVYERGPDPPDMPGQGIGEGTDDEEDEAMWEDWRVKHARWVEKRKVVMPDVPVGGCKEWTKTRGFGVNGSGTPTAPPITTTTGGSGSDFGEGEGPREAQGQDLREKVSLAGRTIQVFVKLGRVELTPDNPSFEGGEWTSEGSFENRVVACTSIVLDSHNVTEGWLDFRMAVTRPDLTIDDPDSAGMAYWGKKRRSPLNQHVGSVSMKPERAVTYPNLYQHRLSPFHLLDDSKPGYRTTLQFQLVDPEIAILSTTDVPPQPVSWAMNALLDSIDKRLPNELVLKVVQFTLDEEYFVRDEELWPLRFAMQLDNRVERRKLGYYFEELL